MLKNLHKLFIILIILTGCEKNTMLGSAFETQSNDIWPDLVNNFDIQETHHPKIEKQIQFYKKHPHILVQSLEPSAIYMPYILSELKKRKMPAELALLPVVESTYNPFAHSHVGASGLWQMMPGTASRYGLKINYWVDGRRDIVASTDAALNHLQYLHQKFGDWRLAVAAYDAGEGRVKRALKEAKNSSISPIDLNIPQETKRYVVKLLALKSMINNPNQYNISLPTVKNKIIFTAVTTDHSIILSKFAKHLTMSEDELRVFNPGFRRSVTQPDETYQLLVPTEKAYRASQYLNEHKPKVKSYVIKRKVTLYSIAKKFKTTTKSIKAINQIDKPNQLRVGQTLLIPVNHQMKNVSSPTMTVINADNKPGPEQITHIFRSGDTLSALSEKYHVKADHIIYWNKEKMPFEPGTQLVIWYHHKTKHYQIVSGDNLHKIAKAHHVSVKAILEANQIDKPNHIRIGQTIEIPL